MSFPECSISSRYRTSWLYILGSFFWGILSCRYRCTHINTHVHTYIYIYTLLLAQPWGTWWHTGSKVGVRETDCWHLVHGSLSLMIPFYLHRGQYPKYLEWICKTWFKDVDFDFFFRLLYKYTPQKTWHKVQHLIRIHVDFLSIRWFV